MTLQKKIAAILDAAVFGGKLFYLQAIDIAPTVKTFGVFSIIGGQVFTDIEGEEKARQPRVQVSVYSSDATEFIAKVGAVETAMAAATVSAIGMSAETLAETATALLNSPASVPVDGFEPETRRYFAHLDFYCWNQ